jgi:2-oxoglutarate ferredoxin oxidoreductase subunit delta
VTVLADEDKIRVDERLCKGCYYCVDACPKMVLAVSKKLGPKGYIIVEAVKPEECIECGLCEKVCPDFAISVRKKEKPKIKAT